MSIRKLMFYLARFDWGELCIEPYQYCWGTVHFLSLLKGQCKNSRTIRVKFRYGVNRQGERFDS
jgi:hypothetical protein